MARRNVDETSPILPPQDADVIVLGAGVTGLTAGAHFSNTSTVVILDEYESPGGNHISRDFGPYSFDIGAIFFWTDSPLLKVFPGIGDQWTPVEYETARICPDGRVRKYPFEFRNELMSRGPVYICGVALDILFSRLFGKREASAASFARYYLGARLLRDSGLACYLRRFYGLPIEAISFNFAKRRMAWIAQNGSIRHKLKKLAKAVRQRLGLESPTVVIFPFARPRKGFSVMYGHALNQLKQAGAQATLGTRLISAEKTPTGFVVHTSSGTFRAPRLISTIPLARSGALFGVDVSQAPESSVLITLCCRFRGDRNFGALILFNFHNDGLWKRLTMHSDYYGAVEGWEYFSVEVTLREVTQTPEQLFEDFRSSVTQTGLFTGELELVGSFRTDFAYPVYDHSAEAKKAKIAGALTALGVETMGRQGDFDYIPSATEAVELAQAALARKQAV
jgi:protoporphyrinogen oxidase